MSKSGIGWLVAGVVATLLFQHFTRQRWEGFVYPDKADLSVHINIGEHRTLEECAAAAHVTLETLRALNGAYECGLNCRYKEFTDIKTCEETAR